LIFDVNWKIKNIRLFMGVLFCWLLLMVSCELPTEESIYEEKLVVFGHLVANSPIVDTFFVSLTRTIEESHESDEGWVTDATVTLSDGQISFELTPVEGRPGRYLDTSMPPFIVHPQKTYELFVEWEKYEVSASTTVPDTFTINSVGSSDWSCEGVPAIVEPINLYEQENNKEKVYYALSTGDFSVLSMDTVIYREGLCYSTSFASIPLFILSWEADPKPGVIRTISLALDDTSTNSIIDSSFSANAFKGSMYVDDLGNYYRPNPFVWNSAMKEIPFSWLYFNYYGPHMIFIEVTSESLQDYFKGDPLRQNPYELPHSNIEGGYGLFSASFSRQFFVYVAPDTTGE